MRRAGGGRAATTDIDRLAGVDTGVVQGALRVAAEIGAAARHLVAGTDAGGGPAARPGRRGSVPEDDLGRPLAGAAGRLAGLAQLLTSPMDAPALVVAAVVHGELADGCIPGRRGGRRPGRR